MDKRLSVGIQHLEGKTSFGYPLGLPNLQTPLKLYICEAGNQTGGTNPDYGGATPHPIAYLSKNFNHMTQRWSSCLQAIAATCDMSQETEIHPGEAYYCSVPHQILTPLEQKEGIG